MEVKSILYVVSRTDTVIRISGIRGLQHASMKELLKGIVMKTHFSEIKC